MPRVTFALLLVALPVVAAPVPTALKRPALGPFGDLTDPKSKCRCRLSKDGALSVTVPTEHPAAEPNEAGPIRLLAGRTVDGDFTLTVRAVLPAAVPGSSRITEHMWAAGIGLAAVGDPQLGAAVLAGQQMGDRGANTVAIFRYSRRVQPRLQGLQGSQGSRTKAKPGDAVWLRLTRRGEVVTGECSADGKEWTEISEQRLPDLPGSVAVGPLVARQVEAEFTALLDEYELTPSPKGEQK